MTDFEKEKIYREAMGVLCSSLSSSENIEASLKALSSLGDYKDAPLQYMRFRQLYQIQQEEKVRLDKRRKIIRGIQWFLTLLGLAVVTLFVVILVYAMRNPPWR